MADYTSIAHRPVLHIVNDEGRRQYGADQEWYPTKWQQNAGCGPTNCAHLMWYLAETRPECRQLCPEGAGTQAAFLQLMETMWGYVTPGNMGVNSTGIFTRGAARYAAERGVPLAVEVLEVPACAAQRPSWEQAAAFLTGAFRRDLPVAFLNLSAGALQNLDSWHWVTLVALRGTAAQMYNAGGKARLDLALWLRTTTMGGGFVCLAPAGKAPSGTPLPAAATEEP